jgi:uncharacterized protein (TIGR03000 family)
MFRRWLICLGVPALAIATALLVATPASAQRWGRGYYGGGYGSYYGDSYYGNPYYSSGYDSGYSSSPYYGGYYGNRFGNRFNRGYSSGYYSPYSYDTSSYYGMDNTGYYDNLSGYTSFYPGSNIMGSSIGSSIGVAPDAALVDVRLPSDAELWFDSDKTSQTGSFRQFVTPSLKSDADNTYTVTALWLENGKAVEQKRRIQVSPGARVMVDFSAPAGSRSAMLEQNLNQGYTSFYSGPDQNIPENAALMQVRLPDNAELWIADQKTTQTGSLREFVTPELDKSGTYTLHAKWTTSDGRQMDQTRKIRVQPGASVMVDFFRQAAEQKKPEQVKEGVREGSEEKPAPAPAPSRDKDQNKKDQNNNKDTIP